MTVTTRTRQTLHTPPAAKKPDASVEAKKAEQQDVAQAKAPPEQKEAAKLDTSRLKAVRDGDLVLKQGERGESVRQAQQLLNNVAGTDLKPDGKFGSKTEGAVTAFQKSQALTMIDGKIGPETMGALDRAARAQSGAADGARAENAVAANGAGEVQSGAADGARAENAIAAHKKAVAEGANKKAGIENTKPKTADEPKVARGLSPETAEKLRSAVSDAVKEMIEGATQTPAADGAAKVDGAATAKADGTAAKDGAQKVDADTPPYVGPTLRDGDRGPAVEAMQGRLKELGYDIESDGKFGPLTKDAVEKFQTTLDIKVDGVVGPETYGKLNMEAPKAPVRGPGEGGNLSKAFSPNERAIATANQTSKGRLLNDRVGQFAEMYKSAAEKTGVPASIIAAIHGQESGWGTHRQSTQGPESGFGLDPRYVSNAFGAKVLKEHGLGSWQRGKDNATNRLQSAVVAAEHFKRNAKQAGVTVGANMSERDILLASTSYIAGANSKITKRAKTSGKSFVFDSKDNNPHPYHPGGTSIGKNGQTIRVPPGRKKGLLRWDVMLPMIERKL